MPLIIQVPWNPDVVERRGPYPRWLDVKSPTRTWVQSSLRRKGLAGYEPVTQATLLALVDNAPDEGLFLDVGAHIGLYSALVACIFGGRGVEVIAVEPTPDTAATARRIARTNSASFEVLERAVSDEPGTTTLFISAKAETSNSLNRDFREHAGEVEVEVVTIDQIAGDRQRSLSVMKIDVETHEAAVLEGALATIEEAHPWIVIEILDRSCDDRLMAVLDRIEDLGYRFYPLVPELTWVPSHPRLGTRAAEGHRDWLLAPEPVSESLAASVAGWLAAIASCTGETSAVVPQGCTFTPGWDQRPTWVIS